MKSILYILFVFVMIFGGRGKVKAIDKNCSANFSYTIDYSVSSFTYLYKDESNVSSTITSWLWHFGDGSTSIKQNPEHQYLSEGTYIVSLRITTSDGSSDLKTDTIFVSRIAPPSCSAYFIGLKDTSSSLSIKFIDHSLSPGDSIVKWYWSFGDGNTDSLHQNPVHNYTSGGIYNVNLSIITAQGCSSSYQDSVVVSTNTPLCTAFFTYKADSVSGNPNAIFFYDQSIAADPIVSWVWYFSDGDSSLLQNPAHIFPYAGIYDVSLKIFTQSGCTSTIHYPIQVGNPQYYNVWGRVYVGNLTTDKCIALLYKEFKNGYIVPVDTVRLTSVTDTLGVFYFYQIMEGVHKVKILLPTSSSHYGDYAPTYYGDNLFWDKTSALNLFQDISQANIQMKEIIHSSGTNQISGDLYYNGSKLNKQGVQLMLLDASLNVYDYTYTDNNGHYVFDDVSSGSFYVYAELTGYYSIPGNVLLNALDTISNLNVNLTNKTATAFIGESDKNKTLGLKVYPNPVNQHLNLAFDKAIPEAFNYEILNSMGQQIMVGNIGENSPGLRLDVFDLPSGLYFVRIYSKDGRISANSSFVKN